MATSDNEIAIGIDLGTTYSCVAVLRYDTVEILTNDQGQRTTPSCVAFNDKERFIGMAAQNQAATNPTNTVFDAKRLIGRRFYDPSVQNDMKVWPFKVIEGSGGKPLIVVNYKGEQKQYEPEMISSMVLLKLKETAEAVLGRKVKKAVVTVPAYFNDSQRQATKDAGSLADLNVIRIINEPTAAAFAYGFNESRGSSRPKNILIFDLGGGTFDVSILSMEGGKLVVKATNGNTHLGGQDFNNRMFEYCIREFQRMFKKDISCNQKAKARLRPCCERAKRALSTSLNSSIEVDALYDNIDFSLNISRAKFEDLNIDLFKQCLEPLRTCLEDARMDKKSIDDVVIVGGSTRIPKVQELLMEFFDKKILSKKINLDEAVAYGAAIQAAKLSVGSSNPNLQAMRLVDITPLSMGIEVEGDVMSVIIPRNTTIPMKKEETYSTCCDNQTIVSIKILEGERARTEDNNLLGEFKLSGIAPAPRGQAKVLVCFEINDNGILNVSAVELSTGNRNQITVTNNKNRLTKQEIERLLKEAERFKADDKEVRRKVEAKHRLESYVYDMKASTRLGYTAKNAIEEIIEWLQDSHLDKVEIYEGKLTYLKNICQ